MQAVLVVGAGPVGLGLAIDLARHGVPCRIIEKMDHPSKYCRAIGVTPRTLEVFEDLGVVQSEMDAGLWLTGMRSILAGKGSQDELLPDLGLPYRELGVPQYETERVLAEGLAGRGVAVERGVELTGLTQDESGVDVQLKDASGTQRRERFAYVVGCDGAHSVVRRAIGATFDGDAYPWSFMLGDVRIDWDLPFGMTLRALRPREDGPPDMFIAIPLPERGRYRVSMLASPTLEGGTSDHGIQAEMPGPNLADLQAVGDDLLPGKPRLSELRWSSIFRISMRLASRYRDGRVFIAGDAAHIHPPTGGQGMNTGLQDAYNLAWKLALVWKGVAAPSLLDSYEAERRPVGAEVIARTRVASESLGQGKGRGPDDRLVDTQVLVSYRGSAIVRDDCPMDGRCPEAGDRAPDVEGLQRQGLGFPLRLFDVLRGTEHILLMRIDSADNASLADVDALADEIHARYRGLIRLAAIGKEIMAQRPHVTMLRDPGQGFAERYGQARAFLIRPDGYIGWRGMSSRDEGLRAYLRTLFGDISTVTGRFVPS